LKQIYDGWTRRGNAGIKKESLLRLNLWSLHSPSVFTIRSAHVIRLRVRRIWGELAAIGSHSFFRVPLRDMDRNGFFYSGILTNIPVLSHIKCRWLTSMYFHTWHVEGWEDFTLGGNLRRRGYCCWGRCWCYASVR
jgi:hypothetical protein